MIKICVLATSETTAQVCVSENGFRLVYFSQTPRHPRGREKGLKVTASHLEKARRRKESVIWTTALPTCQGLGKELLYISTSWHTTLKNIKGEALSSHISLFEKQTRNPRNLQDLANIGPTKMLSHKCLLTLCVCLDHFGPASLLLSISFILEFCRVQAISMEKACKYPFKANKHLTTNVFITLGCALRVLGEQPKTSGSHTGYGTNLLGDLRQVPCLLWAWVFSPPVQAGRMRLSLTLVLTPGAY